MTVRQNWLPTIALTAMVSGNMAHAAPVEGIVEQLRNVSGENLDNNLQLDFLLKVGVIAANGMMFGSVYASGGISAVISEINDCYSRAFKTETKVINSMLCYISDKTIYDVLDQQGKSQGGIWKDLAVDYKIGMQERLSFLMEGYGVQTNMQKAFTADYDAAQSNGQRWVETLTIGQVTACIESGIGTPDCP